MGLQIIRAEPTLIKGELQTREEGAAVTSLGRNSGFLEDCTASLRKGLVMSGRLTALGGESLRQEPEVLGL